MVDVVEIIVRLTGKRRKHVFDVVAINSEGKEVPIKWRIENFGQTLTW